MQPSPRSAFKPYEKNPDGEQEQHQVDKGTPQCQPPITTDMVANRNQENISTESWTNNWVMNQNACPDAAEMGQRPPIGQGSHATIPSTSSSKKMTTTAISTIDAAGPSSALACSSTHMTFTTNNRRKPMGPHEVPKELPENGFAEDGRMAVSGSEDSDVDVVNTPAPSPAPWAPISCQSEEAGKIIPRPPKKMRTTGPSSATSVNSTHLATTTSKGTGRNSEEAGKVIPGQPEKKFIVWRLLSAAKMKKLNAHKNCRPDIDNWRLDTFCIQRKMVPKRGQTPRQRTMAQDEQEGYRNSLFRCFAWYLYKGNPDDKYSLSVRIQVVQFMRKHKGHFKGDVTDEKFDAYLNHMLKKDEPGTNLEIVGLATQFRCFVFLYSDDSWEAFKPQFTLQGERVSESQFSDEEKDMEENGAVYLAQNGEGRFSVVTHPDLEEPVGQGSHATIPSTSSSKKTTTAIITIDAAGPSSALACSSTHMTFTTNNRRKPMGPHETTSFYWCPLRAWKMVESATHPEVLEDNDKWRNYAFCIEEKDMPMTGQTPRQKDMEEDEDGSHGNSFVRCFSWYRYRGAQENYKITRSMLTICVTEKKKEFKKHLQDGKIDDYLIRMEKDRAPGTNLEIQALATWLRCCVYIFSDGAWRVVKPIFDEHLDEYEHTKKNGAVYLSQDGNRFSVVTGPEQGEPYKQRLPAANRNTRSSSKKRKATAAGRGRPKKAGTMGPPEPIGSSSSSKKIEVITLDDDTESEEPPQQDPHPLAHPPQFLQLPTIPHSP